MVKTMIINIKDKKVESTFNIEEMKVEIINKKGYITGIPDDNTVVYLARDAKTKSIFYLIHHPKEIKDYSCFRMMNEIKY
jgi:hypothetical protein